MPCLITRGYYWVDHMKGPKIAFYGLFSPYSQTGGFAKPGFTKKKNILNDLSASFWVPSTSMGNNVKSVGKEPHGTRVGTDLLTG